MKWVRKQLNRLAMWWLKPTVEMKDAFICTSEPVLLKAVNFDIEGCCFVPSTLPREKIIGALEKHLNEIKEYTK